MNSVFTDTETVIEIICTRNNTQLNDIKSNFKQIYKGMSNIIKMKINIEINL